MAFVQGISAVFRAFLFLDRVSYPSVASEHRRFFPRAVVASDADMGILDWLAQDARGRIVRKKFVPRLEGWGVGRRSADGRSFGAFVCGLNMISTISLSLSQASSLSLGGEGASQSS